MITFTYIVNFAIISIDEVNNVLKVYDHNKKNNIHL
jgi:hypothetical protein